MRKIPFICVFALLLFSCKQQENVQDKPIQKEISNEIISLLGKKALLTYPDFEAEVTYLSEDSLHWKTTAPNGEVSEDTETVFIKKLSDHLFFVNWIEKDGYTVSQIIDTKENKVSVFSSFHDEDSTRGQRGSAVLEGSFQIIE